MNIVIALIVFSAIILFHELGHFLLAKANGIEVVEFSLGMGPRLISRPMGGTLYSLKLLPFGGSCMMKGEDEENAEEGSFGSKSVWARISVVAAGPVFNFILAWVLSVLIIGAIGYDEPVLESVLDGFPAQEAGMQAGDRILSINGRKIHFYREISDYSQFHQGKTVDLVCERDGEEFTVRLEPMPENGRYYYGFTGNINANRVRTGFFGTLKYAVHETVYWIRTTVSSLRMLFSGGVSLNDVSGPVGVVSVIGETVEESRSSGLVYVWLNVLNIAILLSANLGVMNLLPIPALDGGRLVFLILEAIRGKRLNPEVEGRIHMTGLMLLLLLMVIVLFHDVYRLFA